MVTIYWLVVMANEQSCEYLNDECSSVVKQKEVKGREERENGKKVIPHDRNIVRNRQKYLVSVDLTRRLNKI